MLVNVATVIPDVRLDIRYATADNFTGQVLYPEVKCFLRRETAEKLARVVSKLRTKLLGIKIFDGYRPLSIQRKLWSLRPDPRYVADPAVGSRHNRGAAVDLTLVNLRSGMDMEMGTEFDDFTKRAHCDFAGLPGTILANRAVLRETMTECGFEPFATEWWHFDDTDWRNYPVLDIPFSELV